MDHGAAELLGLQALAWLSASDELLPIFLNSTGFDAGEIMARSKDPDFLASVLEFLTMDDSWVIAFCAAQNCTNDMPLRARYTLSGDMRSGDDWC